MLNKTTLSLLLFCAAIGFAEPVVSQDASIAADPPIEKSTSEPRQLPGTQPAGQILLPNQWSLKPAGEQIVVGDFPVNMVFHPRQNFIAVLHAGYGNHEIQILDSETKKLISSVNIDQSFYGLCFSPDGAKVYASGGDTETVQVYDFNDGYLNKAGELSLDMNDRDGLVGGVSTSSDGQTLYVASPWGDIVAIVDASDDSKLTKIQFPEQTFPYYCIPSPDGKRLFVSLWGAAKIAVIDLTDERHEINAEWATELHPTEMIISPSGKYLYVACANSNSVNVFDIESNKCIETIRSSLYPTSPNGSTPNSLALSGDGKVLCVANADNNNIAVVDVTVPGKSRSLGFIPAGWYPTSVRISPSDGEIYIASGKGLMPKSNRQGPNPLNDPPRSVREYIGSLFRGVISVVAAPSPGEMAAYTKTAFECSPLREDLKPVIQPRDPSNPIPTKLGVASPIKYCIYIVKENRTYDQVFGDLPQGNGDPYLCIFPRKVTPNHHALAEQFVLLDNFYVESEVSADGHEWSMAAYATDFVEKSWPLSYRGDRKALSYPAEGNFDIATPAGGYIWDRCKEAGVSYRSYGEFIANGATPEDPSTAKVEALEGHFDPMYHGYDMDYMDIKRTDRFLEELARFEKEGEMPQFIVLRLGNDHTYGTRPGKPTPTAMVADNDLALGRLVEGVSKSKSWPETAIFVVQDDAQNGSDHVDAHRTVALAISPYTQQGMVDSSMYSTASMLRTMELILGLKPMSQFDAAARPMYASFSAKPNLTPYQHVPAEVDLYERNSALAWGAAESIKMDFSKEDAADDLMLNEVVWRSVKGADSPMPAPVRAAFVFSHIDDDEDGNDD